MWLSVKSTDDRPETGSCGLMYYAVGLSQRRTCRLTRLSLPTCRYDAPRPPSADAHLSGIGTHH